MNRVLILEDEPLIAMDLSMAFEDCAIAAVTAVTCAEASTALAEQAIDGAVLDVNLGQETSVPLAKELRRLGIPFIAVSGYSATQLPDEFEGVPLIGKPMNFNILFDQLGKVLSPGAE